MCEETNCTNRAIWTVKSSNKKHSVNLCDEHVAMLEEVDGNQNTLEVMAA